MYPDPLMEITANPFPFTNYTPTALPIYGAANPYTTYQHGDMFELGVDLGLAFQCRHLEGCQEVFQDEEQLQRHSETHFAFNRLLPPDRYSCAMCRTMFEFHPGTCFQCGPNGTIEHLIMGSFIRTQTYQRYSPDSHDLFGRNNSSDPFTASMFTIPNANNGA
jgi:hypothetical protein